MRGAKLLRSGWIERAIEHVAVLGEDHRARSTGSKFAKLLSFSRGGVAYS